MILFTQILPRVLLDQLYDVVHYMHDESLPKRVSQDTKLNSFGVRLINTCVGTGLIILNRQVNDTGKYKYCGPTGCSVSDYTYSLQLICLKISARVKYMILIPTRTMHQYSLSY